MESSAILEVRALSKNYGSIKAVKGLTFRVEQGMVFGLLGPNGSGKTTTLGILLGVISVSSGTFSWFGEGTKDDHRKRIGALLETPNFYPYLNAERNLTIVAKIKGLEDANEQIDSVLRMVGLHERRKSVFKTYSLGMKQRLAIASTLLGDPDVLVLDEPINGLDPQGIAEVRTLIQEISRAGKTILIASHQLDEIEKVCSDVLILKKGTLIRQSKVGQVLESSKRVMVSSDDLVALKQRAEHLAGARVLKAENGKLILSVHASLTTVTINEYFFRQGIVLSELREVNESLENQFLEITKE